MEYQTLLFLTPWMSPHKIVPWQKSAFDLAMKKIAVVEAYPGEVIRTPSLELPLPAVARLVRAVPYRKQGVKFSRVNVMTRDNFTCQFCGRRLPMKHLNYDHVVPRVQGGKTVWSNIVTTCYACNERKGGRTPEQAGMRLLSKPTRPRSLPLETPVWKVNKMPSIWLPYLEGVVVVEEAMTA